VRLGCDYSAHDRGHTEARQCASQCSVAATMVMMVLKSAVAVPSARLPAPAMVTPVRMGGRRRKQSNNNRSRYRESPDARHGRASLLGSKVRLASSHGGNAAAA